MKKIKLLQWPAFFITAFAAGCTQRSYTVNTAAVNYTNQADDKANGTYSPPPVLILSDDKAKANKDGELYYEDGYGFRYWRYSDGKYYLDHRYEDGAIQKKKTARKKNTKIRNTDSNKDHLDNG